MITALSLMIKALQNVGADGLCGDDCGCGIDDLCPCNGDLLQCVAAKRIGEKYVPMGAEQ